MFVTSAASASVTASPECCAGELFAIRGAAPAPASEVTRGPLPTSFCPGFSAIPPSIAAEAGSTTPGALAANSPNASCVGAGSSALDPGQRAPLAHFVNSLPGPGGQFVKSFAQQKGTAEECFPNGPPGP